MSDHVPTDDRLDSPDADPDRVRDSADTIECYQTGESTVFFDAENPLAWLEATTTLRLREFA